MTVLHHTWLQSQGGAARVAHLLLQGLRGAGWDAALSYELSDGGEERGILAGPEAAVKRDDDTVLHVHSTGDWPALLQDLASRGRGQRTVVTLHDCRMLTGGCPYPLECPGWRLGCFIPCPRGYPEAASVQCAIRESAVEAGVWLVSPSRWLGRMAAEAFPQLRIRVIPNGVPWPDALLPRAEAKARVGLAPGAGLVLFAAHGGEAAEYKAGSQWRTIWAAIKAEIPHAVGFLVGGGGPERQGDLVLWPHVDRLTMDLFLNAADVVAYPSLADNHPLLVLEAMAQGAAVVASDVGGVAEQIVDGETGVLAASGDWRRLADEAIRLLTKPPWASRMGRTARDVGRDRFAVDRMVRDYLAVYRELLTRG